MKKKLTFIILLLFATVIFVFTGCFGGDSTVYTITSEDSENGTFTCSHSEALANTDITISCTPDAGYKFDYVSINGTIRYSTTFDMPNSNTTIEVFFSPIEYQINYVLGENAFFGSTPRHTYTIEDSAITLPHPTRYGYTFAGWYKDEGLTQNITQIDAHSTGDISIYPAFTLNNNTITYHLDSETTNGDNPNSYTFEDNTITLNDPTKTGYEFLGWYTNDSFSGNPITQIVSGSFNNYNLYPKFVCTKRDNNGFRLIETASDFQIIFIENYDLDEKYKLCTDIDFGGKSWSPKLYFCCNKDKYVVEFSPSHIEKKFGFPKSTARDHFNKLIAKGYLIKKGENSNMYDFYSEPPHIKTQSEAVLPAHFDFGE